jgi:hypothetical protein
MSVVGILETTAREKTRPPKSRAIVENTNNTKVYYVGKNERPTTPITDHTDYVPNNERR